MNQHPYLRAYMAGIAMPTMFLLVAAAVFFVERFVYDIPILVERLLIFPMALVPNLWGLWNILYVALHSRRRLPIGFHGAILLCIVVPLGLLLARALDMTFVNVRMVAMAFPLVLILYYLVWKYLVRFFNELLGIA
jgi:hypothetical protein